MDKWEIRPNPSRDDADRHTLFIQGGPTDIAALLKKFGAMMGRPTPARVTGYNLKMTLHRFKIEKRNKLDTWLKRYCPQVNEKAPPPPPTMPLVKDDTVEIDLAKAPLPPMAEVTTVDAAPPTPPPSPPMPPEEVLVVEKTRADNRYPFSVPMREDWTFETLLVGAYNRFAHAAATSIVSSPGTMYNPLFLYGTPGTGKSHLLQALGHAYVTELGEPAVIHTSGSVLARAIENAVASSKGDELEKAIKMAKVLLIDDIHLMSVSDANKEILSRLFKSAFEKQQQVVITSLYPPRSLGSLEEALRFSFSRGWSVDLKIPNPTAQRDLVVSAVGLEKLDITPEEMGQLHQKLSQWGYSELSLWLRRLSLFKAKRKASKVSTNLKDLMSLIYDPIVEATDVRLPTSIAAFTPPKTAADAPSLAIITPKGKESFGKYAANMFYQVGLKHNFKQLYRHEVWLTYNPDEPFGIPFQIAQQCERAAVTHALIIGPMPETPLGPRAADFSQATRRILQSGGIQMAFVPYPGLPVQSHYLNAQLDFTTT